MAINHPTQHKRSSVAGNKPAAGVLQPGELGINFADKSIYTEDGSGVVVELERDIFKAAAAPASPTEGMVWYDTSINELKVYNNTSWLNVSYSGLGVAASNTTNISGFASGSGTSGDPYIVNVVTIPSADKQIIDTVTVTGLNPGQFVPIVDQNGSGRFKFSNYFADSSGTLTFTVKFTDSPSSTNGTTYTCAIQIGTGSAYINEQVLIGAAAASFPQAVNAPDNTLAKTTVWTSPNDTLTSSGCLTISTDGITFGQGPLTVNTADTLYTQWTGAPGSGNCIDQAEGTLLSETLTDSNGATQTLSMTIDKTPAAFTWTDITGVATSSVSASNTINVSGINSYAMITGTTTGATLEYSKNGGAWTAVPAGAAAADYVVDGDTLQIRHTNGATVSTAYDAAVTLGGTSDTFTSTTSAVSPSVATPSINSPVNGSIGIATGAAITATAYSALNGAGAHTSTDWEIYSDAGLTTLVDSSMADTVNLTSWTPSGLSNTTQYWVRVKYRSSDPVDSSWSSVVTYTTAGVPVVTFEFTAAEHPSYTGEFGFHSATLGPSPGAAMGNVTQDLGTVVIPNQFGTLLGGIAHILSGDMNDGFALGGLFGDGTSDYISFVRLSGGSALATPTGSIIWDINIINTTTSNTITKSGINTAPTFGGYYEFVIVNPLLNMGAGFISNGDVIQISVNSISYTP